MRHPFVGESAQCGKRHRAELQTRARVRGWYEHYACTSFPIIQIQVTSAVAFRLQKKVTQNVKWSSKGFSELSPAGSSLLHHACIPTLFFLAILGSGFFFLIACFTLARAVSVFFVHAQGQKGPQGTTADHLLNVAPASKLCTSI